MTCIVGIACAGKVWMGADSFALAGEAVYCCEGKLFRRGEFIIGVSGDWRYGEILAFALEIEKPASDIDIRRFMATDFAKAVFKAAKEYGFVQQENGQDNIGESRALVGVRGCLFNLDSTLSHLIIREGCASIGSGSHVALGSLYESQDSGKEPKDRLERALLAAEAVTDGVRAPFIFDEE